MNFDKEVLTSELKILMEKEREMRDLYNRILEKLDNPTLNKRIMSIRDDERKHMGYVEIIISLIENEPGDKS
jgi:rubrerythrin